MLRLKGVNVILKGYLFMFSTDKAKTTFYLEPSTDRKLRVFCAEHGKSLSESAEAMILHCLENPHFIDQITKKEATTC